MKVFNNGIKLFQAEIVTVKLKAGFFSNVSIHIHPLTFINKALCLSSQTHTHTNEQTKAILRNQACVTFSHVPGLKWTN